MRYRGGANGSPLREIGRHRAKPDNNTCRAELKAVNDNHAETAALQELVYCRQTGRIGLTGELAEVMERILKTATIKQ